MRGRGSGFWGWLKGFLGYDGEAMVRVATFRGAGLLGWGR